MKQSSGSWITMRSTVEHFAKGELAFPMSEDALGITGVLTARALKIDTGFFQIDGEFYDAIKYAEESPAQLPPLPFPRVLIDIDSEHVLTVARADENGESVFCEAHGFFIEEVERGQCWEVLAIALLGAGHPDNYSKDTRRLTMSYINYRIMNDTEGIKILDENRQEVDSPLVHLRTWVVEMAHLITAKNIEHVPESRQVRRATARKLGVKKVNSYTIRMSRTKGGNGSGEGNRRYTCRWIVRGHRREYKTGKIAWIDPYIKGPAGAPWRNPHKPVYIKENSKETM